MAFGNTVTVSLINDVSPTLGGNLDVNDFQIISTENRNIVFAPDGTGKVKFQPETDSTTFFQVLDADGGTPIFNIDAVNERIGVGNAAPETEIHVSHISSVARIAAGTTSRFMGMYSSSNSAINPNIYWHNADNLEFRAMGNINHSGGNALIVEMTAGGDLHLPTNDGKLQFGATQNASITFDGTNMVINPHNAGTDAFLKFIYAGSDTSEKVAEWKGNEKVGGLDNDEAYQSFTLANGNGIQTEVARLAWSIPDTSPSSEVGAFVFSTIQAGALTEVLRVGDMTAPTMGGSSHATPISISSGDVTINDGNLYIFDRNGDPFILIGDDSSGGETATILWNSSQDQLEIGTNAFSNLLTLTDTGEVRIPYNNKKLLFGADQDASITYDGTDLIINPQKVGSGNLKLAAGGIDHAGTQLPIMFSGSTVWDFRSNNRIVSNHNHYIGSSATTLKFNLNDGSYFSFENTTDAVSNQVMQIQGNERATALDNDEAYMSLMLDDDAGTSVEMGRLTWVATDVTAASPDARLEIDVIDGGILRRIMRFDADQIDMLPGTGGNVVTKWTGTTGMSMQNHNDVHMVSDSGKVFFGAADDASITYDGTDLIIDPKEAGSGYVDVLGDLNLTNGALLHTARDTLSVLGSTIRIGEAAFYTDLDLLPNSGNVGLGTSTYDGSALNSIAIANGTAPAAGTANQTYIYSADISSSSELFAYNEAGEATQLTGLLGPPSPVSETEIDVGTTPVEDASVNVVNTEVSVSSKMVGGVAYKAPTGKDLDELDEAFEVKFEPKAGSFNVLIKGLEGSIADKFIIWYSFS